VKILHLIHSLTRGGIEMWLLSMLRTVSRAECAMDVCCKGRTPGPLAGVAQQFGAQVHGCPLRPGHISFVRGLRRLLRHGRYDLLHCHLELYSGVAVAVARSLGIPVIASFHNTRFQPQTPLTKLPIVRQLRWAYGLVSVSYALRRANLVTGCSNAVLQAIDPRGRTAGRSRVLHYGVDLPVAATVHERAAFREAFGWTADTPVLLHVGRFLEQKNHPGVLAVFQRALERVPSARLLLVGDGMLRPAIENQIAQGGLMDRVRLLGSRNDVPALMSCSDVLLLPSRYEGFGLVAIEASSAYLPVVGSRIPGLTEAVRDGETARLHDISDVEGMAGSVTRILTDASHGRQMGQAGRSWVEANFSTEASAQRLLETYRAIARPAPETCGCLAASRG
jgi:glycosyltransferase EpsF